MLLHRLWHTRKVLVPSLVAAVLAVVLSGPRVADMSTASTQALVDNPSTIVLDVKQGSYQLQQLAQSATLLGNVMVSIPLQQDIARRAGIPSSALQTTAPATPQSPQALTSPNKRKTGDLFASNDQYRINVQANPTVPMLTVYTEARTAAMAKNLANASVASLRAYVAKMDQSIPANQRVNVYQLGRAEGGTVTGGLRLQSAALVFFFAFVAASALGLGLLRVVEGWKLYQDAGDVRRDVAGTSPEADAA
jgi:opacity protein-like surface antigen